MKVTFKFFYIFISTAEFIYNICTGTRELIFVPVSYFYFLLTYNIYQILGIGCKAAKSDQNEIMAFHFIIDKNKHFINSGPELTKHTTCCQPLGFQKEDTSQQKRKDNVKKLQQKIRG